MDSKICVITGANAGIGKETALTLAKKGFFIILICRNPEKGKQALRDIRAASSENLHDLFIADFADLKAVDAMTIALRQKYNRIDVLINNAGLFHSKRTYTKDGIELLFQVNYLTPFMLTLRLLDLLKQSPNARIINISSVGHYFGNIYFNDLLLKKGRYDGLKMYNQTKLANVLFSFELARRLAGTGITVNALSPGMVNTNIPYKNAEGLYPFLWTLSKPFLRNLAKGAETSVYLASAAEVANISGKYFYNCKAVWSAVISKNEAVAAKLWAVSEQLLEKHYKAIIVR
jgi:NAD(P)-dependent dehydrogenase (short-subunit alcohol dehydrogenase family)